MKQTKKWALAVTVSGMALVLCSCSTAASNANRYFTSAGAIATNMMNSGKVSNGSTASAASESTAAALPTPGDFTMSEDGTYSFTGVDGAGYYLLYFCEPGADPSDDSFIYTSEPINAVSSTTTYTGSYLDVMQAAYGEYQARVVAFPAVGDTTSSMSSPACVDFIAEGEQSLPTLEYFWDSFSDTLNLQLSNVGTYTYEAYPKEVEVVCTNVNDDADVVTATLENVATDNIDFSVALTKGETYKISAHAISDSNYVTNKVSGDTLVADNVTVGDVNVLSSAYAYSHGIINFPLLTENFDLVNGGSAGDMHGVISDYSYDCTPVTPTPGSAYSYYVSIYFADQGEGQLELYEDGTATLSHGQWAMLSAAHIDGVWIDNGDGTATLNFDNSSVAPD